MAAIPDFTSIPFAPSTAPTPEPEPRKWMTPEGVEVKNLYKPEGIISREEADRLLQV